MTKCCICGDVFDVGYEMTNGDYVCDAALCKAWVDEWNKERESDEKSKN